MSNIQSEMRSKNKHVSVTINLVILVSDVCDTNENMPHRISARNTHQSKLWENLFDHNIGYSCPVVLKFCETCQMIVWLRNMLWSNEMLRELRCVSNGYPILHPRLQLFRFWLTLYFLLDRPTQTVRYIISIHVHGFVFICSLCPVFITLLAYAHNSDVIMGTMASQITSLTNVYSTVYSVADQRGQGQRRGKYFHLMTSSWCVFSTYGWHGASEIGWVDKASSNHIDKHNICMLFCMHSI